MITADEARALKPLPDVPKDELDEFLSRVDKRIREAAARGWTYVWIKCERMRQNPFDQLDASRAMARAAKKALVAAGFDVSDGFRDSVLSAFDLLVRW